MYLPTLSINHSIH